MEKAGAGVSDFRPGDHVLISCITSCGKCGNCRKGMYSHCESGGGWILGNLIDGTQAEYVRIPFLDSSLYHIPEKSDEEAIMGAGPIGLATLLTAQFYSPAEVIMIDLDDNRLEVAGQFGATRLINGGDGQAVRKVMALTGNRGVDVAIEAVGIPQTFDVCQAIVAPGGHIANIGVHGKPVQLNLDNCGRTISPLRHGWWTRCRLPCCSRRSPPEK